MANVGKGSAGHPDRGWPLFLVSVVMVIISGLFVTFRIALRVSRRMMGTDDYIIILALLTLISLTVTECVAVTNGYGKHTTDLTTDQLHYAFRWFYGAQITYKIAVALYKESMLFLYLRIFPGKNFRIATFAMITFVGASGVAFVLVTIWQCSPIEAFWNKALLKTPGAHCFSSEAFWFSYSVINILTDVGILLLPIHEVWKLQLPLREKLALCGVFSLGIFVCATTIIRTTTLAAGSRSNDPSWGVIPATIWSVVEANTGTICACLPMLKQPLTVLFPRLFLNTKSSFNQFGGGHGASNSYAMHSKQNRSRQAGNGTLNSVGGNYKPWALDVGDTAQNGKDKESYSSRESEDRERLTTPAVPQIMRTTSVNVEYEGMGKPVPAKPTQPRAVVGS